MNSLFSKGRGVSNAAINVMPEGEGGDEVSSLIVRVCPTWGILANFEHK